MQRAQAESGERGARAWRHACVGARDIPLFVCALQTKYISMDTLRRALQTSPVGLLSALSVFAEECDSDEVAAASMEQRRALLVELRRVCLNADVSIRAASLRSVRCVSRVCFPPPTRSLARRAHRSRVLHSLSLLSAGILLKIALTSRYSPRSVSGLLRRGRCSVRKTALSREYRQ